MGISYKNKYEELYDKFDKLLTYVQCYGHISHECLGCGEYVHDGYICGNCGLDPSGEECFDQWIKREIEKDG